MDTITRLESVAHSLCDTFPLPLTFTVEQNRVLFHLQYEIVFTVNYHDLAVFCISFEYAHSVSDETLRELLSDFFDEMLAEFPHPTPDRRISFYVVGDAKFPPCQCSPMTASARSN